MLDSLRNGALPDVAELPPQLKAHADVVWENIFYTGVAGAGVELLGRAFRRQAEIIILFGRIFLGVALCATIFTSSGWAQTTRVDVSHSTVAYDFDGITGSLSVKAYEGDSAPYDLAASLGLSCTKDTTRVRVSFWEDGLPNIDDLQNSNRGWITIGDVKLPSSGGSSHAVAVPGGHILVVAKALYEGTMLGTPVGIFDSEAAFSPDGSRKIINGFYDILVHNPDNPATFRLTFGSPFVRKGVGPNLEHIDDTEVKKEIGRFHQLCSIWWGD